MGDHPAVLGDDGYFDERVAATYDESEAELFEAEAVDPVVDFLAEIAGNGQALELGIGTGRIAFRSRGAASRSSGSTCPRPWSRDCASSRGCRCSRHPRASVLKEVPPESACLLVVATGQQFGDPGCDRTMRIPSHTRKDRPPVRERAVLQDVVKRREREPVGTQMSVTHVAQPTP